MREDRTTTVRSLAAGHYFQLPGCPVVFRAHTVTDDADTGTSLVECQPVCMTLGLDEEVITKYEVDET